MDKPQTQTSDDISPARLRLGIVMVLLWWIPFWVLTPFIDSLVGATTSDEKHEVLVAVLVIQTLLGLAGVLVAGKQVKLIFRGTPRRKVPKKVFHELFKK